MYRKNRFSYFPGFLIFLIFLMGFWASGVVGNAFGAILVPDTLYMSSHGATGTHCVTKTMILGFLN